jgi:hypothetical protein
MVWAITCCRSLAFGLAKHAAATVMVFFRVVSREGFNFIDSAIPMHSSLIRSFPNPGNLWKEGHREIGLQTHVLVDFGQS